MTSCNYWKVIPQFVPLNGVYIFVQWKFVWEKIKTSVTSAYIACATGKWYHSIELAEKFLLKHRYWTFARSQLALYKRSFERQASLLKCNESASWLLKVARSKILPHATLILITSPPTAGPDYPQIASGGPVPSPYSCKSLLFVNASFILNALPGSILCMLCPVTFRSSLINHFLLTRFLVFCFFV